MPAKELLKDRDKRFRLLFEDHPQPMWVFDGDSQQLLEANAAASHLYGYSREEFRAKRLSDLNAETEVSSDLEILPTRSGVPVTIWRHRTATGRVIELEAAVHDIEYGGRNARLAVLLDITGRRHLEEQLRQAQKMEAVGMLAGGVAHDFNNLLTIITGYSQLILNNLGSEDPNRHSVEQIMKAGERAAALTKQLLAFSRRQVLQPRVLELNKLITSLGTMLQRLIGEDIDLRLVLPPELGRVSADPGQIEQVLMNLVVNARDAMPTGGVLTVETGNVKLDANYAKAHIAVRSGPYIMISVSDTGSGMDEATKARLFEPFFTTKGSGKGTGLGLSTVFGIVKQSGGSVEVYSEAGRGTSVKVYLPRIDQPASLEAKESRRKVGRGSETVLLVEDDEMVRTLVRETLERDGYRILDAPGPLEARRISDQHKEPIQLLITDVVMPKVSGRELAQQLVERRPSLKVLYMSGYSDNAVVNSGILKKEVAFIQKPFTPTALTEKVREVLEGDGSRTRKAGE
jgi:two-component system, cell cycle sensor histidine kinase and response regulator CckA